jgi:hypothetical protein
MATPTTQQAADTSINDSNKPPRSARRRANMPLRGPAGPTTQRGKQKSRQNATKHGIFSVGIVRRRESQAEYLRIVQDMAETLQPMGRLEEILVEKLAMLVWRYRRLLQAEAAEVARETEVAEEGNSEGKTSAMRMFRGGTGLIPGAFLTKNEVALEVGIEALRKLRQLVQEKGLNWERDREALKTLFGSAKEQGKEGDVTIRVIHVGEEDKGPDPCGPLAGKYRELVLTGKDQDGSTNLAADAAESMVGMLTEEIEGYKLMFRDYSARSDRRNRLQAATALVPRQDVTDRLQRYEASLERSFDRTLSQFERLQRLRLGQPVPPALKVDVSR